MARTSFDPSVSLEDLRAAMAGFVAERDWQQFHTPRNVLLAMTGEVGEVAEIFQWRGEVPPGLPGWDEKDKVHLGEELSDVLLYLIRLADICGVDLPTAAIRKMQLNGRKYPVEKARGRSDKYTQYAVASSAAAGAGGASADSASAAAAPAAAVPSAAPAAVAPVSWKPLLATAGVFAGVAAVSLLLKRAR